MFLACEGKEDNYSVFLIVIVAERYYLSWERHQHSLMGKLLAFILRYRSRKVKDIEAEEKNKTI